MLQEKLAKAQAESQSKALHHLEQERLDRAVAMRLAHDRGEDSATVGDVVFPRMAPAASASMPRRPATVTYVECSHLKLTTYSTVLHILMVYQHLRVSLR